MGRRCGFIALQTAVAGGAEFAVLPEIPFDIGALCKKLKASRLSGKNYSLIILAEGVMSGYELQEKLAEQAPGYKATVTVLGHIQRGGAPSSYDAPAWAPTRSPACWKGDTASWPDWSMGAWCRYLCRTRGKQESG